MEDNPPFFLMIRDLKIRGVFVFIALFFAGSVFAQISSSPHLSSYPDTPKINEQLERSRQILMALFFEKHYRYDEALQAWKSISHSSTTVADHIFQNELMLAESISLESVPPTVISLKTAVSYLKWQKRWSVAFDLLEDHALLVSTDEELMLMQVMLALYLRRYDQARAQLEMLNSSDLLHDDMQLELLWSWYYTLTEQQKHLREVWEKQQKDAFYYPDFFVGFSDASSSWPKIRQNAIRALTRFPSDRELRESIVRLFQRMGETDALETIVGDYLGRYHTGSLWMVQAEICLQKGQLSELKQLLDEIREYEMDSPDYLSFEAQAAILGRDWMRLKTVATRFQQLFPGLLDGDRFMSVYKNRGDGS